MRAQRLQRATPEFLRNVAVWFDMIGDTGSDDLAFAQAHKEARTEADDALGDATRPCRATCPSTEIPPADSLHKLILSACGFPVWKAQPLKIFVSNTNELFSAEVPTITMSSSAQQT